MACSRIERISGHDAAVVTVSVDADRNLDNLQNRVLVGDIDNSRVVLARIDIPPKKPI